MIYLLSPLKKDNTISLPMISFKTIAKNINFSNIDTLMFTSKQAVVTANKIDNRWKEFPSIAIGGATKKKNRRTLEESIYILKSMVKSSIV